MKKYKYLIVGGGMTADSAAGGIRQVDTKGTIGLVTAEPDEPYDRPPLSKKLWKGKSFESIWRKTKDKGVEIHLGNVIKKISPGDKTVIDAGGETFKYEKLLLATGGRPRILPFGGDQIIYFRTVADYRYLRDLSNKGQQFAVIGGGFIGSEIAAALAMNGKKVVMIFPGKAIGDRLFPPSLSQFISDFYKSKGVDIIAGGKVVFLEKRGDRVSLKTDNNRETIADGVIAGIGIEPNIELAQGAMLKLENGIVVDEFLRTTGPEIFSAGDVAAFYNPALGKRIRVEHEDNANTMGQFAGRNMAGSSEPYNHLPYFYSDMFELGYEAIGELNSSLEIFMDWKQPNEKGVIYYLQNGRVRGVLLWNVWKQVDAARQLIAQPGPFQPDDLKGRLG